jgi:hypothetical protein
MLAPVVFFSLVLLIVAGVRARRWWRRRGDPLMFVTTWPEIEYQQPYGGWDADAYDAGTGHDRQPALGMTNLWPGPRFARPLRQVGYRGRP